MNNEFKGNKEEAFNNEHHITPEELIEQLKTVDLHNIAGTIKDSSTEHQNFNKTQYITAEELIDQLESAGLHEIAQTIKDSPTAAYNVAEDILITNKLNNMPEGSFAQTNFSKEDLEKYHNMSEEIIAQMLLDKQKLPIGSKISELRENFNPTTSDNDNKPTNK